ncbi:MAG: endosialidase [Lachnospiraceae bacterium]|nr:endosialidase [Lachnospiraceae bacterium]
MREIIMAKLISMNSDKTLNFGCYTIPEKQKDTLEVGSDVYKVKTFCDVTKLEKNECFEYESVPGTKVEEFKRSSNEVSLKVEGIGSTDLIFELEPEKEYAVCVDGVRGENAVKANIGGKITVSLDLPKDKKVEISIKEA